MRCVRVPMKRNTAIVHEDHSGPVQDAMTPKVNFVSRGITYGCSVVLLHAFGTLSEFQRADALGFTENLRKIAQGGESQQLGDLGHGEVGFCQKVFAFIDPPGDQIIDGGHAVFPFKGVGEIVLIDVCLFGQQLQSERFFEVQVDVSAYSGTLAVGGCRLQFCLDRQRGVAHQTYNQDLHVRLTDIFVACVFQFHFPENIPETGGDLHALKMIQNTELAIGIFVGGQLDPVDAHNDILQRLCIQADLRVGDIGINDDQIIGVDGKVLILYQKLPLSADDEKQFGMAVRVGDGVPVAAVSRAGDVQQFCRAANGKRLILAKTVVISAQIVSPFFRYIYIVL